MTQTVKERLEELRKSIVVENISYGEIVELQGLSKYIDKGDTLLLEWAGVPEREEDGFGCECGTIVKDENDVCAACAAQDPPDDIDLSKAFEEERENGKD
jgi:hypothetical protein